MEAVRGLAEYLTSDDYRDLAEDYLDKKKACEDAGGTWKDFSSGAMPEYCSMDEHDFNPSYWEDTWKSKYGL